MFVQYDKQTGVISSVLSSERQPKAESLPPNISQIEVEDVEVLKRGKVNLQTFVLEDRVKTKWELFKGRWTHKRIVTGLKSNTADWQVFNSEVQTRQYQPLIWITLLYW